MKEEEFKLDSFIGGWYIPEEICTDLIKFFENKTIPAAAATMA